MAQPGVNEAAGLLQNLMAVGATEAQDWTCCFATGNDGLVLGVRPDSDADKQLRIASDLGGGAPIRVVKQTFVRHANKQQRNRPIVGGIGIRLPVLDDPGKSAWGTLGVVVAAGRKTWVITAGHVVDKLDVIIHQPFSGNDTVIGKVTRISDWRGHATSDSALVELSVDSTPNRVWKGTNALYTVASFAVVQVWMGVYMQGASTTMAPERLGMICAEDATVRFTDEGVLTGQYLANYLTNDGDSGAPVYTKNANGTINLIGINVGGAALGSITHDAPNRVEDPPNKNGQYAVISKWHNILHDLNLA